MLIKTSAFKIKYIIERLHRLVAFLLNNLACEKGPIEWSECSKTCGGGRRTGTGGQVGGDHCTRTYTYRGWCNTQRCPSKLIVL